MKNMVLVFVYFWDEMFIYTSLEGLFMIKKETSRVYI